jgi:2-octaprenyl-6-methoxyphenol hydroxylase
MRAAVTQITPGEDSASVEYSRGESIGTVRASLVVVADGGTLRDDVRSRVVEYGQTAVVATVIAEQPHRNTAFERFTATGPLALLPCDDRYALIWA